MITVREEGAGWFAFHWLVKCVLFGIVYFSSLCHDRLYSRISSYYVSIKAIFDFDIEK